jgi:hypothetical protein
MKTTRPSKPVVFVASPYTKGDVAINVHFQCEVFDRLLNDGLVVPLVPLWTHFQHTVFPRPYSDWVAYDQEILKLCDCCLRLNVEHKQLNYVQSESSGADAEVEAFRVFQKPVFFAIDGLYGWVKREWDDAKQAP